MNYSDTLKQLSTYTAVSGNEQHVSDALKALLKEGCDSVKIDPFYNVVGVKKGEKGKNKKIMITAHFDEIGFLVKCIDEKGFVRISPVGGIDSKILLAQEVMIHGKRDILGVVGAKPPHLLTAEERKKSVKMEDLIIDTGMRAEKLKELVSIGDTVTFKSVPMELQGKRVSGKTMDNRCGVTALLGIMQELQALKHQNDIYFVATTQEEVGLRGATISAYNGSPDVAIVIDACHGDMPDVPKDAAFSLGKGPAIAIGPNLHKKLTKKIMDVAKEENIAFQVDVEPEDTGTEAWATQVSREGIPTALISIPVRYMHTAIETVHAEDIKNTARLVARFVSKLGAEMEEILCY